MNQAAVIVVGVLAGAWLISRASDAAAAELETDTTALDYLNPWGLIETMNNQATTGQAIQDRNIRAFLAMIGRAEGTDSQADAYRVCYGYSHTVKSLADHPAVTGEWKGKTLTPTQCAGAGYGPGCVSTAAGRYQITKPTWLECKRALKLPDFSPDSQDRAAVYLINKRGALAAVQQGRLAEAIELCRREWASFPGANYAGQGARSLAWMQSAYQGAGGVLA